jgi:hypothetical protein
VLVRGALDVDLGAVVNDFRRDGFALLGNVASEVTLAELRRRADDLMLGRVTYPGLFFQRDAGTGRYEDLPRGRGWEGPGLFYRKVEKLELDPVFRVWMNNALFARVARAIVGTDVTLYRAVLFTKPASGGTPQPWHQDAGSFWGLDRDPTLQIWTALDDAPADGGCLEVVPGSHRGGLATPLGGVVPDEVVASGRCEERRVRLPARAGDAILVHNLVWHASGINRSGKPRRALSICLLDAATRCLRRKRAPRTFCRMFV